MPEASPELARFARLVVKDGEDLNIALNLIWCAALMLKDCSDPDQAKQITQELIDQANAAAETNSKALLRARAIHFGQ